MDGFRIERVDYEDEYGSGEDLAAMLLAEALAGDESPVLREAQALQQAQGERAEISGVAHDGGVPRTAPEPGQTGSLTRPGPEPLLTRPLQAVFCEHLARHGNVRLACRAARVSAQTAYRMRRASASFRQLWDAALVIARDQVEDVLADRAVHGWEEAVFYHGEEVARRRRYDSRLLLAHLARLDKLAERSAGGVVERFDEVIDALAADEEVAALRQAQDERVEAQDERVETQDEGDPAEGTPLVEAQLLWLEAEHGALSEEEEAFHLHHTVPGVPGSALRRFGWRGTEAELAALNARWRRLGDRLPGDGDEDDAGEDRGEAVDAGPDQPCSSSMLTCA